jgi:hypothetical protein
MYKTFSPDYPLRSLHSLPALTGGELLFFWMELTSTFVL